MTERREKETEKRREQPASDKQGSWQFPERLSQDSLPLSSFFWFHKNCQQSDSPRLSDVNHYWALLSSFYILLVVLFPFLTLPSLHTSILSTHFSTHLSAWLLLPTPGHQLFKTHVVLCSYTLNFLPACVTSSVGQHVWVNSFKSMLICITPFRKEAALLWRFPEDKNICRWSRTHPPPPPNFV